MKKKVFIIVSVGLGQPYITPIMTLQKHQDLHYSNSQIGPLIPTFSHPTLSHLPHQLPKALSLNCSLHYTIHITPSNMFHPTPPPPHRSTCLSPTQTMDLHYFHYLLPPQKYCSLILLEALSPHHPYLGTNPLRHRSIGISLPRY